ncbi:hypothetical protein C8J35_103501 [Rhizobium sp. PP-F2F-G38]|nr:hypothetical protein C8J35_103501 [Rhizobium sp. PP-F2F-G38]
MADALHDIIKRLEATEAAYNDKPASSLTDLTAERAAFDEAFDVLKNTTASATTYAGAMAALRFAHRDMNEFSSNELVKPLVNGALAYFESIEAQHPWDKARRVSRELSEIMGQCDDGHWFAQVKPPENKFTIAFGAFPMGVEGELPNDRINHLSWELSEALANYEGGAFQAMVLPANVAGHTVMLTAIKAFDGRQA